MLRRALLAVAASDQIRAARQNVDKEQAYFADPKHVADFYATRGRNEADVKFCWK